MMKAVRKLPSRPSPSSSRSQALGTVLVEMRNEHSRSSIMKNKHLLQQHQIPELRCVVVKNMRSRDLMFMENLGNNLLKRIPGCENLYVTPNGQIREKNSAYARSSSHQFVPHNTFYAPTQQQTITNPNYQMSSGSNSQVSQPPPMHNQQHFRSQEFVQQPSVHQQQYPSMHGQHPPQSYYPYSSNFQVTEEDYYRAHSSHATAPHAAPHTAPHTYASSHVSPPQNAPSSGSHHQQAHSIQQPAAGHTGSVSSDSE